MSRAFTRTPRMITSHLFQGFNVGALLLFAVQRSALPPGFELPLKHFAGDPECVWVVASRSPVYFLNPHGVKHGILYFALRGRNRNNRQHGSSQLRVKA